MTLTASTESRRARMAAPGAHPGFRPDIEGLRAVAIGLVLLYHAGWGIVSGGFIGVDVFFVLSGFLITGLLIREVERTGRISLKEFYARRAKRLLPAAALVLAVSALVTWLTGSVVEWATFGGDIVAAAIYLVNWRLAERSVDYLAEGTSQSPVQHFWSLAVEEQFYIVWPLVLLAVVLIVRRTGIRLRPAMATGLALVAIPSLVWSVVATANLPAEAFFVTTTRLWELAIGAFVAVGAPLWAKVPVLAARILGWAGMAVIAACALVLDETAAWPGSLALLPTLATAAVVVSGSNGHAPRLLSARGMVWIGGLSYSLYLWHWPLLIGATNLLGGIDAITGTLVVIGAILPAWLSLRLVENPIRRAPALARSAGRTLVMGLVLTLVGVLAGFALVRGVPQVETVAEGEVQGAAVLRQDGDGSRSGIEITDSVEAMTPQPVAAVDDVPSAYDRGCQVSQDAVVPDYCEYGDPEGGRLVVLAGDSKALQWVDALDRIAKDEGWRLLVATKSSCGLYDAIPATEGPAYEACQQYNTALLGELVEMKPAAVIVSQRHSLAIDPVTGEPSRQAMVEGTARAWKTLVGAGIEVTTILDNPVPVGVAGGGVYKCVAENLDTLTACSFDRAEAVESSGAPAQKAAAARVPEVKAVTVVDLFCDEKRCPAVIGNVLVYRQGSHVTNTYALSAVPILRERLR
ncbi:acyltransferase family protein [Myceligenerans xiligouense]|uniref:Peptidoglycan/LPS O-acetylase OafA/YrhL n=1 Tax=Myceligenerans xiligouense TaxID=253184 RepID=A0A3N4Z286_9MICO|nr:acyltransferase family protein [Myceligenerans xiligouense]RPF20138.1 peptidoglycan/LPS O-acetylase OafA/YrhL [Myceligenerans xiligouense]